MITSQDVLSENGSLKKAIPGFAPRIAQQKMADAIERAIELNSELIIEAGTGTGKTFGYLVPILLSQKKAIISTGTKNLQDQLFLKDVPVIKKILNDTGKIMLLKGRANYLCLHRLEKSRFEGRFVSRQHISELEIIREWANATQTGDIAELDSVPEDSGVWPHATSTVDNCLNQECPFIKNCFMFKARQQALSADVVIVNHHLFFADLVLQEEGFGELLPGADVIVFDEAHHLPDVASLFFSTILSSRQLLELARDCEAEAQSTAKDMQSIAELSTELQKTATEMRFAMGDISRREPWPSVLSSALRDAIQKNRDCLQSLESILKTAAVRSKELENCWRRTIKMIEHFNALTGETPENTIHWFETFPHHFTIHLTPMVVAPYFQRYLQAEKKRAWIFTSATLTVKNHFHLFTEAMGLEKALQLQLKSPFDYTKQALLYVPRGLPDARAAHYIESLIQAVIPVLQLTQGKAFLLFTSYKALAQAETLLRDQIPFPLLIQGSLPKHQLIDQFKTLGNAVLLGTSSFWYGVDVRGDALSCVVIDKFPFGSPEDPILQARVKRLKKQGIDPFLTYQLPQAVLTLKQGAGRLIRDNQDRGILMICDPRLVAARYGETFLQSLPDMPRTRELNKVKEFMETV